MFLSLCLFVLLCEMIVLRDPRRLLAGGDRSGAVRILIRPGADRPRTIGAAISGSGQPASCSSRSLLQPTSHHTHTRQVTHCTTLRLHSPVNVPRPSLSGSTRSHSRDPPPLLSPLSPLSTPHSPHSRINMGAATEGKVSTTHTTRKSGADREPRRGEACSDDTTSGLQLSSAAAPALSLC